MLSEASQHGSPQSLPTPSRRTRRGSAASRIRACFPEGRPTCRNLSPQVALALRYGSDLLPLRILFLGFAAWAITFSSPPTLELPQLRDFSRAPSLPALSGTFRTSDASLSEAFGQGCPRRLQARGLVFTVLFPTLCPGHRIKHSKIGHPQVRLLGSASFRIHLAAPSLCDPRSYRTARFKGVEYASLVRFRFHARAIPLPRLHKGQDPPALVPPLPHHALARLVS